MYVYRNISPAIILRFAWANLLFFGLYSGVLVYIDHAAEHIGEKFHIPFVPLSVIGIAVAFYLGFKNNASYDRFWEARKIWGGIVNTSRTWANQVMSFVTTSHAKRDWTDQELHAVHTRLIYRHMAWMNALRLMLRRPARHSIKYKKALAKYGGGEIVMEHWKEEVGPFLLKEEIEWLRTTKNSPAQIVRLQGEHLKQLMEDEGLIEDFRHMELMGTLTELYTLQGKCERIKNTPFPRQYAFFSKLFVWIFILLLPFGLIGTFRDMFATGGGHYLAWQVIPFHMLISWIFITMERVGDNSEDPFENFVNDVPMTALCRTIEIDLRQMLKETDIPGGIEPEKGVLL